MRYLVLLFLGAALCAQTPKARPRAAAHPNIGDTADDCLSCHRGLNPQIVADWDNSKHGSRDVPCITCHGAVGAGFVRKPASENCVACHAEMVKTLSGAAMKGKDCFSCHAPHSLNPHKSLHQPAPAAPGGKKS